MQSQVQTQIRSTAASVDHLDDIDVDFVKTYPVFLPTRANTTARANSCAVRVQYINTFVSGHYSVLINYQLGDFSEHNLCSGVLRLHVLLGSLIQYEVREAKCLVDDT